MATAEEKIDAYLATLDRDEMKERMYSYVGGMVLGNRIFSKKY